MQNPSRAPTFPRIWMTPRELDAQQAGARHIPYLDGWRGIAILCVLLAHFNGLPIGGSGVTIFFALSGVLMTRILFVDRTPLSTFYRRRAARILPVFWLYVVTVFAAWRLLFQQSDTLEFVTTLTFLRSYIPDEAILHSSFPIGPVWSLNVEEHSYLLLSLLTLPATRYGPHFARWSLALLALLCVAFFLFYKHHPPQSQTLFHTRSEVAAFPLLLSSAVFLFLRSSAWQPPAWIPLCSLLGTLVLPFCTASAFIQFIGVGVLAALAVNTLHAAPHWLLAALSHPVLRWLGLVSFSLYLWHQLFFFFARYATHPAYAVLAYAGSLVLAACSFYLFEQPMRRRLSGSNSRASPAMT